MAGKYAEQDKLDAEVDKLRAETKSLAKPFLQQPASWIALGTLAISLAANFAQHSEAQVNEKLAKIEEEQHKLNRDKFEEQELQLEASSKVRQKALDEQSALLEKYEQQLKEIQAELSKAGATKEALTKAIDDLQNSTRKFETYSAATGKTLATPLSKTHDIATARRLETQGFDLLTTGNFEGALAAFTGSENANNGYHHSYEISNLLRQHRLEFSDPAARRRILQNISTTYSLYATNDQQMKLKELAK